MQLLYSYRPPKQTSHRLNHSERAIEASYQQVHRKIRQRIAIGGLIAVVVIIGGVITLISGEKSTAASELASKTLRTGPSPVITPNATINSLITNNSQYQIGVAMQDVSTGEHLSYGLDVPFEAASTGKLLTAVAYYHEVEAGQASLTDMVGSFNAQYQLQQMINQSNNQSWQMLADTLGLSAITQYATSLGIDYQGDGNTISPSSMVALLAELYNGKVLDSDDTKQLLSYMQNTNDEDLIPAAVPDDITVYHKYGLVDGELHDVAILAKGGEAYTLAIYTKDTDDSTDSDRTNVIHSITKAAISQLFKES